MKSKLLAAIFLSFLVVACGKDEQATKKEVATTENKSETKEEIKSLPNCVGEYSKDTWTNCVGARNLADGSSYKGDYVDGKASGQGVYTFADGSRYEGGYLNGKRNGYGKEYFADGKLKIDGSWEDGKLITASPESVVDEKPMANNEEKTQQQLISKQGKYMSNIQYQNLSDGSCKNRANIICLNQDEYKRACKDAIGVSSKAIKMAVMLADRQTKAVIENGTLDKVTVIWVPNSDGCGALVEATGIVDGNSIRRSIAGRASEFILNSENKLVVSYIDTM